MKLPALSPEEPPLNVTLSKTYRCTKVLHKVIDQSRIRDWYLSNRHTFGHKRSVDSISLEPKQEQQAIRRVKEGHRLSNLRQYQWQTERGRRKSAMAEKKILATL